MGMTQTHEEPAAPAWGESKITLAQANEFAQRVTSLAADREIVARNLFMFPPELKTRGLFFEGLSRVVAESKGPTAMANLQAVAGLTQRTTAFRAYPHRDFYRLYYLASRLLYPSARLAESTRLTARTFFPIFRNSLLGRTMSALMGDRPSTLLPLLAKSYNLSVEGNDHKAELKSDHELLWTCEVEPIDWYTETFSGIVEGAMPANTPVQIRVEERAIAGTRARYQFRLTW